MQTTIQFMLNLLIYTESIDFASNERLQSDKSKYYDKNYETCCQRIKLESLSQLLGPII